MLGWDAARQIVVEHEIGADGSTFHGTHHISKDGSWISPYEGSTVVDGKPVFFESYRKIAFASQDEWSVAGAHWTLGEGAEERRIATFTRRTPLLGVKSPTEADAEKVIDTLVGRWALTFEEDGEERTATITAEESGSELALRLTYKEPGEQPANGMLAWHSTKKQIVETWFREGEHVRICFDRMTDDGAFTGSGEGMLEGERFTGCRILKFHSPNRYTHTMTGTISEGEPQPDVTLTAERIVSKSVAP